jgi:hypothetical protein
MHAKKIQVLVGAVFLLLLGGMSYQFWLIRKLSAQLSGERMARDEIKKHALAPETEGHPANSRSSIAKSSEPPIGKAANNLSRPPAPTRDRLFTSPEASKLMEKLSEPSIHFMFGPFYAMRGLNPQQIESFERLLFDAQQQRLDLAGAATENGVPLNSKALLPLTEEARNKLSDGLLKVLGNEGYQQYSEFLPTVSIRKCVQEVASELYYTATPVTPADAEKLVKILADCGPKSKEAFDFTSLDSKGEGINWREFDWDRVANEAAIQGVSNQQLTTMQTLHSQAEAIDEWDKYLSENIRKNK